MVFFWLTIVYLFILIVSYSVAWRISYLVHAINSIILLNGSKRFDSSLIIID